MSWALIADQRDKAFAEVDRLKTDNVRLTRRCGELQVRVQELEHTHASLAQERDEALRELAEADAAIDKHLRETGDITDRMNARLEPYRPTREEDFYEQNNERGRAA